MSPSIPLLISVNMLIKGKNPFLAPGTRELKVWFYLVIVTLRTELAALKEKEQLVPHYQCQPTSSHTTV